MLVMVAPAAMPGPESASPTVRPAVETTDSVVFPFVVVASMEEPPKNRLLLIVAETDIRRWVASTMLAMVAPAGMPDPINCSPTLSPAVEETVTAVVPL